MIFKTNYDGLLIEPQGRKLSAIINWMIAADIVYYKGRKLEVIRE